VVTIAAQGGIEAVVRATAAHGSSAGVEKAGCMVTVMQWNRVCGSSVHNSLSHGVRGVA